VLSHHHSHQWIECNKEEEEKEERENRLENKEEEKNR
jgi:hypothetical protein